MVQAQSRQAGAEEIAKRNQQLLIVAASFHQKANTVQGKGRVGRRLRWVPSRQGTG